MSSLVIALYSLACFFSIGLIVTNILVKKKFLPKQMTYIGTVGATVLLYYILFFIFIINVKLGHVANVFLHGFGTITALSYLYNSYSIKRMNKHILIPAIITLLFFCFYSTTLSGCRYNFYVNSPQDNLGYCLLTGLPIDNSLPFTFATNVKEGLAKKTIGDWKLVDRPPAQIGAALSISQFSSNKNTSYETYQYLAIFLQLSWIGAMYGFLVLAGIKLKNIVLILLLTGFNGFIFINSIYVWPKLLSASLVLAGLAIMFIASMSKSSKYLSTSLVFFTLALITHGGVLFTVLGSMPILFYILLKQNSLEQIKAFIIDGALVALVLLVIIIPWVLYKSANTQSDRLIKWHIAGVISAQDNRDTLTAIKDSYSSLTLKEWAQSKYKNVETIFIPQYTLDKEKSIIYNVSSWVRYNQFFVMIVAIGLFNIGWIEIIIKKYRSSISDFERYSFYVAVLSTIIFILSMFRGGSTVLHQGSYATMLLLFSVLGIAISKLGSRTIKTLVAIQSFIFYLVWVYDIYKKSETASLYLLLEFSFIIFIILVCSIIVNIYAPAVDTSG